MSILVVTPELPPTSGGIGTNALDLARLWGRSEKVTVVAPALPERRDAASLGLLLEEIPWQGVGRIRRALGIRNAVRRLVSETNFDVIYSVHWRACGAPTRAALLGTRDSPPLVQAVHGSEILNLLLKPSHLDRAIFNWTARGVDLFTAQGSFQVELLRQLGIGSERVVTSTYGVEPGRFRPPSKESVDELRRRYNIGSQHVLLTVGRLVERKGHDIVIRAMPEIRRAVPDALYVIAGRGDYAAPLHRLIADLGLPPDAVLFTGQVGSDDLSSCFALADVFVMPNRIVNGDVEGFGLVFAEAALFGKPAIGGRSGGAVDAIVDGVTGRLVDPTSIEEVAAAAIELLSNPRLAVQMGAAGRERALSEFDYSIVAPRLRSAFPTTNGQGQHTAVVT